jgi:hypothetical protein
MRLLLQVLLFIAASFTMAGAQDMPDGELVLQQAAAEFKAGVGPTQRELYRGLAASQIIFRSERNFNGYESNPDFLDQAIRNLDDSIALAAKPGARVSEKDIKIMVDAYRNQRDKYLHFLNSYADAVGAKLSPNFTDLLIRSMALNAVASATKTAKGAEDSWFGESWIWPFCFSNKK